MGIRQRRLKTSHECYTSKLHSMYKVLHQSIEVPALHNPQCNSQLKTGLLPTKCQSHSHRDHKTTSSHQDRTLWYRISRISTKTSSERRAVGRCTWRPPVEALRTETIQRTHAPTAKHRTPQVPIKISKRQQATCSSSS